MKNQLLRIISIFYLICLTIVFLIPLDAFLVTQIVEVKNQPSNNTSYFIHFALFFILYFTLYFTFLNQYKILIFCTIYAIFIEIFQIFNSRGFQINDIIFNIIGLTVSFIFLNFLFIFIKKK